MKRPKPGTAAVKTRETPSFQVAGASDAAPSHIGLWVTSAAALLYCIWLGVHWLPLDISDKELAASASRVWDIRREIVEHHHIPWWTAYFMSGSSYGLNHARGLYLVPWLLFSTFTDLITAGKLVALSAIFASAVAMYFCARHFLKSEWAAVLSAFAFMLHPEQLIRAAAAEHVTISLSFVFIPLLWWTLARALESNAFRDTFLCALVAALAWWADNKQAFIHFLFLSGYVAWWIWARRRQWQTTARTCGVLTGIALVLAAPLIAAGVVESPNVKLFSGDPLEEWQRTYSFKSLLELVDRDGLATRTALQHVSAQLEANGGRVSGPEDHEQIRRIFSLSAYSAEKYMGVVLLSLIGAAVLCNDRRVNRRLLCFLVLALLASIMCATEPGGVWSANATTSEALASQGQTAAALAVPLGFSLFVVALYRRKLTSNRKRILACTALVLFLFVPAFGVLAELPYFRDIRAPYVFYDGPGAFFAALLAGFFVTDVLGHETWRSRIPTLVLAIGLLLLLDYWPYQKPTKDSGVSRQTLTNLRLTYESFRPDRDWVKTYSISNRYFHLLGPLYGGKPQAYEAFYNWMAPLGSGALNQVGGGSPELLDLLAVRYVVFDKSDPGAQTPQLQKVLAHYRQALPVAREDDDFVVFRNDTAHRYVTAYAKACAYVGDVRESARLSLALAGRNWPLVQRDAVADYGQYEKTYRQGSPAETPEHDGNVVALTDLQLARDDAQQIRIHLSAPQKALVVIAESYYPYWHAEIDGSPAEVLRVSTGLMGLAIASGPHDIVLRYTPPIVYEVASGLSLLTLVACVAFFVRGARNR